MTDDYSFKIARIVIGQILDTQGFDAVQVKNVPSVPEPGKPTLFKQNSSLCFALSLSPHIFQTTALDTLADLLIRYIRDIGRTCKRTAELGGRTLVNLNDLLLASKERGINLSEIEEYATALGEELPFAQDVPNYPIQVREQRDSFAFRQEINLYSTHC